MRFVLILAGTLLVQGGIYYYLWRRLVHDTKIVAPWKRRFTAIILVVAPSVPLTFLVRKLLPPAGKIMGIPVFFLMALAGLTATFLLMVDSARLLAWATKRTGGKKSPEPINAERRAFMHRVAGGGAALSAVSLAGQGVYQAMTTPKLRNIGITLRRLPRSLHGFSIVQLTDIHIGYTIGEDFVTAVVEATNAANADLVVITGDLVDGPLSELRRHAAPLAKLRAPHGVYFVTGNHEYYSGVDSWLEYLGEIGIRVLRNERVRIGDGDDYFDLAGIDDHRAYRYPGHGPDLERAVAGRDRSKELVLLAHQPRQVHEATKHDVGLQLSGHTHGGQIWPWHYIAKASQKGLLAGHSRHGDTQLYISRGTGYWGPPVRVFAKSEITRVTLYSPA